MSGGPNAPLRSAFPSSGQEPMALIEIDGSQGEGGGQVLRTALALSLATGKPFRMERIRAGRAKPGLMRQHLTCVRAAKSIGGARTRGDELGGTEISFTPARLTPGDYRFSVGTAGSTLLVLQAVLPALMIADGPSRVELEGGTHNHAAPSWEFFAHALAPRLLSTGPSFVPALQRCGFYPAGGGKLAIEVRPGRATEPFALLERGAVRRVHALVRIANLPPHIAVTERDVLIERLGLAAGDARIETCDAHGPGNAAMVFVESDSGTEVFTGFGQVGLPAARLAEDLANDVRAFLDADVPVGPHLADQLLVPLALAGGGRFRTGAVTLHARTAADVVKRFLKTRITFTQEEGGRTLVEIADRSSGSPEE